MSHPPFMIIPQNATPYYPTGATPLLPAIRTPLLFQSPIPPPPDNNGSTPAAPSVHREAEPANLLQSARSQTWPLTSIPSRPREKSTRTLIIDHLLWVHSRTRFSQARAELGMTDRTGGSSSVNYVHRERPESFEEEDEAASDGRMCVRPQTSLRLGLRTARTPEIPILHFARQSLFTSTPSSHPLPRLTPLALFAAGVDPSTSPAPRCPRHLYTACTICIPPRGGQASRRPVVTSFPAGHPNTVTGWQDGSGIGSGLSSGPKKDDTLLRRRYHGSTNLVELIRRFLNLSALVAMELGLEADEKGSVGAPQWNSSETQNQPSSPPKGKGRAMSTSSFDPRTPSPAQQQNNSSPGGPESVSGDGEKIHMQLYALRPSADGMVFAPVWLTRAVLEGYVCGGWKGLGALETLMKVGLGLRPDVLNIPTEDSPSPLEEGDNEGSAQQYHHHQQLHSQHHHHDNPYEEFDPDDFPTIIESCETANREGGSEQEYEYDMEERLTRFYDVQPRCPDLLTHLEDISWQYPTEPLERAMLRFFEAIMQEEIPRNLEIDPSIAPLTMDALLHSSPIVGLGSPGKKRPRGPRIEKYFLPPPQSGGTRVNGMGLKRRRESVSAALGFCDEKDEDPV
ncbi:hypothetical protein BJ322DRAFT_1115088 [Thelephora terrestris]|uniref:Uncharacterized protein n=1 Tax=Thelephora terrestris TaxID=56493 RepID=A0A9P6H1B3_9AGAM|nr:hypothetical protein BJ322DRAFT_1115088 [Thelephora terrestris]